MSCGTLDSQPKKKTKNVNLHESLSVRVQTDGLKTVTLKRLRLEVVRAQTQKLFVSAGSHPP